jgi:beta-lactam-binding protein with PASTA domain
MLDFLRSRRFLFNLLGAIGALALIMFIGSLILSNSTQHGETISVPNLSGKKLSDVKEILSSRHLEFKVTDSSFSDKLRPLCVIDQVPKPESKVKEGRTIYLTINAINPPKVKMPDLKDASLKQAQLVLQSTGLRVGKLIYKPDLAQNAVLDQLLNDKSIVPGTLIPKGTHIDLVLGDGLGQTEIQVPNLIGRSLSEAKFYLDGVGLNLGSVIKDNSVKGDSSDAYVYRQIPDPNDAQNMIKPGEPVDVYVTFDMSKIPAEVAPKID